MILITSFGEFLLYFIVIFILFSLYIYIYIYIYKNSAAGLFSCAIFMLQENKLQWIENS